MKKSYDVALSFAGEDRTYVEMVAEHLLARGVTIFYDEYETAELWGRDLYEHLTEIYRDSARYMLMFISRHYRDKVWTQHERRAAQARAMATHEAYILPARFDDTDVPGLLETTKFIDLRTTSPAEVAFLVAKKLGKDVFQLKASAGPSPKSPLSSGRLCFDYLKYDGRFRIGKNDYEFETVWSNASNLNIHSYNSGKNVHAIGLVPLGQTVGKIDVTEIDFTSSSVTASIGESIVLRNLNGFYAVVRIDGIKLRDPGNKTAAELSVTYWILTDDISDFAAADDAATT